MIKARVKEPDINLVKMFDLKKNEELISLDLDDKNIGYGIIRDDGNNKIEVFILEQYQNNGYGNYLFVELLKRVNNSIRVSVPINNSRMVKIVTKNGGFELGRDGKNIMFLVPKINSNLENQLGN